MKISAEALKEIHWLSDTKLLGEAEQCIATFLQEGEPISSSQLNSLENILESTHDMRLIQRYLQHQHSKVSKNANPDRRNKDYYLTRFYEELKKQWSALQQYVLEHPDTFSEAKSQANTSHYYLFKEFVQHLIADHNFRAQTTRKKEERPWNKR